MEITELVNVVFTKLTLTYGRDFTGRWEGLDLGDVKNDWAHELRGYERAPHAVRYALKNLPAKPPSVVEFKALCLRAPSPEVPQLKAPRADPTKARQAIEEARKKMMAWKSPT